MGLLARLLLKAAADVGYIGHSTDGDSGTLLRFEVPRFGRAAPALFSHQRLCGGGPALELTVFQLVGAARVDVATRRADNNRFGPGLLCRFARRSPAAN